MDDSSTDSFEEPDWAALTLEVCRDICEKEEEEKNIIHKVYVCGDRLNANF
jgi:hypothetical protein